MKFKIARLYLFLLVISTEYIRVQLAKSETIANHSFESDQDESGSHIEILSCPMIQIYETIPWLNPVISDIFHDWVQTCGIRN